MNPFRSKIKCVNCGSNFRRKKERGKYKFICSGYHNGNGCKKRIVISEEELRELINRRYNEELTDQQIKEVVDYIKVEDKYLIEIYFSDGNEPILFKEKFIKF